MKALTSMFTGPSSKETAFIDVEVENRLVGSAGLSGTHAGSSLALEQSTETTSIPSEEPRIFDADFGRLSIDVFFMSLGQEAKKLFSLVLQMGLPSIPLMVIWWIGHCAKASRKNGECG